MTDLDYAYVTGRFGLGVGDTEIDDDDNPDIIWCDSGRVIITPLTTFVKIAGATAGPFTMGDAVIETTINEDGYLTYHDKTYVSVVDLASDKVNPQIEAGKATHRVTFAEVMADGTAVAFPSFECRLVTGGDGQSTITIGEDTLPANDLTIVAPVVPGEASPIVRGEKGVGIVGAAIIGGTNLQLELTDGSTVDAGELPAGPGGSDPGVAIYLANPASATSEQAAAAVVDETHPVGAALAAEYAPSGTAGNIDKPTAQGVALVMTIIFGG